MSEAPSDWEEVLINDLPQYQESWVSRILGINNWETPIRDIEKIDQEYDQDKYQRLLSTYEKGPSSPKELHRSRLGNLDAPTCVSVNSQLFTTNLNQALEYRNTEFVKHFSDILTGEETIIELGSGYGRNLSILRDELANTYPNLTYIGGEYSQNAVQLGSKLYYDDDNIHIRKFNYYDGEFEIPDDKSDIIVFTSHSVEQLPTFSPHFEKQIFHDSNQINKVLHFEPVTEMHEKSAILGLLRRRYTELNDYNTDLQKTISGSAKAKIESSEYDMVGLNPLNPTSIITWTPEREE